MMNNMWTLEGDTPRPCSDVEEWARWMHETDRRVALDRLAGLDGEVVVSTAFMGLNIHGDTPPVLWETLVQGGPLGGRAIRYTSAAEAAAGHRAVVASLEFLKSQGLERGT